MTNDNKPLSVAELEAENDKLRWSLARCEKLVTECREKLFKAGEASFLLGNRKKR